MQQHIFCVVNLSLLFSILTLITQAFRFDVTTQSTLENTPTIENDSATETSLQLILDMCPGIPECLVKKDVSGVKQLVWSNLTYTPSEWSSCCMPCQCTSDCLAVGNCCIVNNRDILPQYYGHKKGTYMSKDGEICLPTTYGSKKINKNNLVTGRLVIQHCPRTFNGPRVEYMCINRDILDQESMTPVYSERLKLHFANKHCAACHGEFSQLISWEMGIACESAGHASIVLENGFPEPLILSLGEKCTVFWEPMNSLSSKPCNPYTEDFISTCPYNTLFNDSNIYNLCYRWISPIRAQENVYKNVYCRICHDASTTSCQSGYFGSDVPFTLLLSYRGEEDLVDEVTTMSYTCQDGLTYIPELDECLTVSCPISSIRIGNRCLSLLKDVRGVTLDYSFVIEYDSVRVNDVTNVINHVVTFVEADGKVCDRYIGNDDPKSGSTIVEKLAHVYVQVSNETDVHEKYKSFANRLHAFGESQEHVNVSINWVINAPPHINKAHVFRFEHGMPWFGRCSRSVIAMTELQFCNVVQFSDFTVGDNDVAKLERAVLYPQDYVLYQSKGTSNNPVVIACLSKYASNVLGREADVDIPWLTKRSSACSKTLTFAVLVSVIVHILARIEKLDVI